MATDKRTPPPTPEEIDRRLWNGREAPGYNDDYQREAALAKSDAKPEKDND